MNTIEAIAWIRCLTGFYNYPENADNYQDSNDALENSEKADNIIELLQRGEKDRKVIEKLKSIDAHISVFSKSNETISMTALEDYLDEIEKEVK